MELSHSTYNVGEADIEWSSGDFQYALVDLEVEVDWNWTPVIKGTLYDPPEGGWEINGVEFMGPASIDVYRDGDLGPTLKIPYPEMHREIQDIIDLAIEENAEPPE